MGRNSSRTSFGGRARVAMLAVFVMTVGSLSAVAAPSVGADCPNPLSGHWTGTWASQTLPASGTIAEDVVYAAGHASGTITLTGSAYSGGTVSGTYSCADIVIGTVDTFSTFTGTFASNGLSASGTYTAGSDHGTWSAAFEGGPLEVTQTLQPTSITATGAASWVVSVYNPGPSPAYDVEVTFYAGTGAYGDSNGFETSSGGSCFFPPPGFDGSPYPTCSLGVLLPGQTETASGSLLATGLIAPTTITVDANAYATTSGQTGDAPSANVEVVSPAQLPPDVASGIAQPGVVFQLGTTAPTPAHPIRIRLKLPARVAAGTAMGVRTHHTHRLGRHRVQLVSYRPRLMPRAATVKGQAVPISLSTTSDEASTFCDGPCSGDVINLSPFSHYTDPKHPAKVIIDWDASTRGAGTASRIYKRADSPRAPRTILNTCVKANTGYTNLPCVFKKKQLKTGDVEFTLLMLSGDPKFARR